MKRYFVGLCAVALALVTFAFTSPKEEKIKADDYVWYIVKPGTAILCNNFANVTVNDLVIDSKYNFSTGFLADISDVDADQAGAGLTFLSPCTAQTYLCAVGYLKAEAQFELNGDDRWVPTSAPIHKLCRTTIP